MSTTSIAPNEPVFENPFRIEDLRVFDEETLKRIVEQGCFGVDVKLLALALHTADFRLVNRVRRCLPVQGREQFNQQLRQEVHTSEIEQARRHILDNLFWELTYWKTPDLYEELTEGECLHPGIFRQLAPDIRGKVVLDAGAGSGRATLECLRYGAEHVYAIEPSPGLLRILGQKLGRIPYGERVTPRAGRFDNLPLEDNSVDLALSCSAFTAEPEQGGEPGLAELRRVTKNGGKIVLIWPRVEDRAWLQARGFHYVSLPERKEMRVHFRSLKSALACAHRFYARNHAVAQYLLTKHSPDVPFSVLGMNPPRDYCWCPVDKA